jgi:hypothetical protein
MGAREMHGGPFCSAGMPCEHNFKLCYCVTPILVLYYCKA